MLSNFIQVCIGEVLCGSCVGESLLRGQVTQPYSVISATRVRVGWVPRSVIRGEAGSTGSRKASPCWGHAVLSGLRNTYHAGDGCIWV